jgi:hypothetical protein
MIFAYVNKNRFLFRMNKKHTKKQIKTQNKTKQKRTELEDTNDYD